MSLGSPTTGPNFARATTDEQVWRAWADRLPEVRLRADRVLVVAPHPDDETLGLGTTLADWAADGVDITVLTVTDGEGSHPGRPGLVDERAAEQHAALRALGIARPAERLGLPDTAVADHEAALAEAVAQRSGPGTLVLAPWEHDGHGDHEATGRAARSGAHRGGAAFACFPVWAWRWATPSALTDLDLVRLPGSPAAQAAKARALACYRSQLEPVDGSAILPTDAIDHFRRPYELISSPCRA